MPVIARRRLGDDEAISDLLQPPFTAIASSQSLLAMANLAVRIFRPNAI